MANNVDLDDFFKKKDRKSQKNKKQPGILTNNQELLKQLVSVTSATSAFKDNMDFVDDEDEAYAYDENNRPSVDPAAAFSSSAKPSQPTKTKTIDTSFDRVSTNNQQESQAQEPQPQPRQQQQQQQQQPPQEEWEEFEDLNLKYEEMRARFSRANPNDENVDDSDNSDDLMGRDENSHLDQRDQQKDKPVWRVDQIKPNEVETPEKVTSEEVSAPAPVQSNTNVYRPPQRRTAGGATSEVTIIGGSQARPTTKKKQPNLASTEEFPTLGGAPSTKK